MNTFPKQNKLCGKECISALYRDGKHFVAWPLRVTYRIETDCTQVLVWAPKTLYKKAVDRNHLRRLIRETFRLNQDILGEQKYQIAFNYIDKEKQPYKTVEKAMRKALRKIKESKE